MCSGLNLQLFGFGWSYMHLALAGLNALTLA